jgi:hypothetical protein
MSHPSSCESQVTIVSASPKRHIYEISSDDFRPQPFSQVDRIEYEHLNLRLAAREQRG